MAAICTCIRCKREFESRKSTAKYCPNCRVIVNREKTVEQTRQIRAEAYEAERDLTRQQAEADRAKRERKFKAQEARRLKKLQADADAGDLIARLSLALNEKDHLHTVRYWSALQAYQLDQLAEGNDYVVNDVSVHDPDFPQRVIDSLKREKQIASHYIRNK